MATQGAPNTIQKSKTSQSSPLSPSRNQIFPFLKLPRELRDKIYRSALVYDGRLAPSKAYRHRYSYPIPAETQLFLVSQQIYDEAREIFLDENVFEYQETYKYIKSGPSYGSYKIPRKEQQRSIDGIDALKNARKIRAMFGGQTHLFVGQNDMFDDQNDMIADFINLLVQNQSPRSLELRFHNITASFVIACQTVLPKLEAVKVRDSAVFDFQPRRKTRLGAQTFTKREREFEEYLEVLEKKMLTK